MKPSMGGNLNDSFTQKSLKVSVIVPCNKSKHAFMLIYGNILKHVKPYITQFVWCHEKAICLKTSVNKVFELPGVDLNYSFTKKIKLFQRK
jgi:hypothetical protein